MRCLDRKKPLWWPIGPIVLVLAATQPLLALWIAYGLPEGVVPTGLHIPDSALFLYSMRMFDTGFESRYATCQSPWGDHGIALYAVPHLWLYGALGAIGRFFHANDFVLYGFANGVGAAFYLLAAYALLRVTLRERACLAFVLFALSGGLGGVLYLATGLAGLHDAPGFEDYFRRFALYELFEGPHLLPVLHMPRLYYTVSLGLCLSALALFIHGMKRDRRTRLVWAGLCLVPAAFIDMRYGVFTLGVAALYLFCIPSPPLPARIARGAILFIPGMAGALLAAALFHTNPAIVQNHLVFGNVAMWLSPFVATACWHLLLLPVAACEQLLRLEFRFRLVALAALGYLALFSVLFCAYQVYYGNVLVARDGAVAVAISDLALTGVPAGVLLAIFLRVRRKPSEIRDANEPACTFLFLWFLTCFGVSISAFRHGEFLRLGPQRIEVLLWLPLCALSAGVIDRWWRASHRRCAGAAVCAMLVCGVASIVVSTLCFQGPLGYRPGVSPYAEYHTEAMTDADAQLIDSLDEGRTLAPIPMGDIVLLRRGNPALFGIGSFNLTDQPYQRLESIATAFFAPETSDAERRKIVNEWDVQYVVCPDTWPASPAILDTLRNTAWLETAAADGKGAVFRVR